MLTMYTEQVGTSMSLTSETQNFCGFIFEVELRIF